MRHDIVTEFFSFMTFCRYQDFVIADSFDRHKLQVVDYKSLSVTKYDQLVFSFQRRKSTDDFHY